MFKQYYCYKDDCPARTPERPWPHGEVRIVSEGQKRPVVKCPHCKRKMTAVANSYED